MTTLCDSLRKPLELAERDQRGGGGRWTTPSAERLRQIRAAGNFSQSEFCRLYGFDLESYRRWEQGRGQPENSSRLLLRLIEDDPEGMADRINRVRADPPEAKKALERA